MSDEYEYGDQDGWGEDENQPNEWGEDHNGADDDVNVRIENLMYEGE